MSQQQRQSIVFDFGGVLMDWNPHYLFDEYFNGDPEAVERFLAEIGFKEWNYQQDWGRNHPEAVAELVERFPQYAHLIHIYNDEWPRTLGGAIQPTVDLVYRLRSAGEDLHALTNWSSDKFWLVRPSYPFMDCFKTITVSGDEKIAKPDPRIFEICRARVGRPASECVYIDDAPKNVETAHSLGFDAIWFESTEQLAGELRQRGLLDN